MNSGSLADLCVLITRPADRAQEIAQALTAEGGRAVLLPAIEIRARRQEDILEDLAPLGAARSPLFVFVSAYAVTHGLQSVTEIFGQPGILDTAAVGETTAQRLEAGGCRDVIAPVGADGSEALLELLEAVPMEGRQVIILRGPPGREKLAQALTERSALVTQVSVYQRVRPDHDSAAASEALQAGEIDVVMISSVEVFENLDAMLDDGGCAELRRATLLVPSERVIRAVREYGAQGPMILAAGAGDEAMLAALRAWRRRRDGDGHKEEQDMSENNEPEVAKQPAKADDVPAESAAETPEPSPARSAALDEKDAPAEPAPLPTAKEKKSGRGLAALALLLALAAAAGSAYLWWQSQTQGNETNTEFLDAQARTDSDIRSLRTELASRDDQLSDLLSDQQGLALQLGGIEELNLRVQNMESELESMRGVSTSARRNWVMAEASYFLQAANASLQLNRNVSSALSALVAADDRLASLSDPALLSVRSMIASERQALSSLPQTDTTGIALALGNLAARAGTLRTKTDNPGSYATSPGQAAEEAEGQGLERAKRVLGDAVKSLVTVRRTDQQASALLAPEEEFFLARNLELQLLTARLALLNEQPELFRQSIATSLEWLATFFDPEAPEVADAVVTLKQIEAAPVQISLPDISRSLALLRAIQAQGSAP